MCVRVRLAFASEPLPSPKSKVTERTVADGPPCEETDTVKVTISPVFSVEGLAVSDTNAGTAGETTTLVDCETRAPEVSSAVTVTMNVPADV